MDVELNSLIRGNRRGGRGGGRRSRGGREEEDAPEPVVSMFGKYSEHDDRGTGGAFRSARGSVQRDAPYKPRRTRADGDVWTHDRFDDDDDMEDEEEEDIRPVGRSSRGIRNSRSADGGAIPASATKIHKIEIENLDFGVTEEDIQSLMESVGNLKKSQLNYDRNGQSLGTATAVFRDQTSALAAVQKYNKVTLDGRPMNIRLVVAPSVSDRLDLASRLGPRAGSGAGSSRGETRITVSVPAGNGQRRVTAPGRRLVAPGGRGGLARRGGARTSRTAGGARSSRQPKKTMTAEELDAEMDEYLAADGDNTA